MVDIKRLTKLTLEDLQRAITGYTTDVVYRVHHNEADDVTNFKLELVKLDKSVTRTYQHLNTEALAEYQTTLKADLSLGLYDVDLLMGLALVLPEHWNNSVHIQEFHIAPDYRGRGYGQQLMQAVIKVCQQNFRVVICETQTTNVPAIRFYRRCGFSLAGIDVSYYTNTDTESGEIAVFMKYYLPENKTGQKNP